MPYAEEEAAEPTRGAPFLVEDLLGQSGGQYAKGADWQSYMLADGADHRTECGSARRRRTGAAQTAGLILV